jgi:hypothetical protein
MKSINALAREAVEQEMANRITTRALRQTLPDTLRKLAHTTLPDRYQYQPNGTLALFSRSGAVVGHAADVAAAQEAVARGDEQFYRLEADERRLRRGLAPLEAYSLDIARNQTADNFCRAAAIEVSEVDRGRRTIRHIVGTPAVDSHGTVINPDGMSLDRWAKSGGPVPWMHGLDPIRGMVPVATSLETVRGTFKGQSVIIGTTRFHDDDAFSEQLWKLYRDQRLRGWSLRFNPRPGGFGPPTKEEIRQRPELASFADEYRESGGRRGYIVRSSELTEYSAVSHPSNSDTVTLEVLRSMGGR